MSSFVNKKLIFIFIVLIGFSFFVGLLLFPLLLIAVLGILVWLFRKTQSGQRNFKADPKVIYAPCSGVIDNMKKVEEKWEITIKIPFLGPYQIELPCFCEMGGLTLSDANNLISRQDEISAKAKLTFDNDKELILDMNPRIGLWPPRFWLQAGDVGKQGAIVGLMPFGGEVKVILPGSCQIVSKENSLAAFKDTIIAIKG